MTLFKHQQEGINFALKNQGNCALFWDPGLGKTLGALEVYRQLKFKEPNLRLLVVCPLSLVNSAWGTDINKFTNFKSASFRSLNGNIPDIVIINYESLISARILPQIRNMLLKNPFMCVLDESSRLKSNKSLTTKTLLSLVPYFKHRIILSGTPMPNSELELWGQARFVRPDSLDKSFYAFRNHYFHLERNGQTMQSIQGKFMNRMMMREMMIKGWRYTITPFLRKHLMYKISNFSHWVKKEEALDLPEKIDQIREVSLSGPEIEAYRDMKNYLVAEINGQMIAAQVALAKIMKLREATSGFFYNSEGEAFTIGISKIKELQDLLEELGNQQVIIFSNFHYEFETIKSMIAKKYGPNKAVTLYADTENKDESIIKFQQGKAQYLIAHPRSAAHGLTFVNCSTMIFFSLDYSWEAHEQARNRIHRIGQKDNCLYIYLIARNTIDETLLDVLNKKQGLQDAVYTIIKGAESVRNKVKKQCPAYAQKGLSSAVHF